MGKVKEQLLNEALPNEDCRDRMYDLSIEEWMDYIEKNDCGGYDHMERDSDMFKDISDEQYYSSDFLSALDYAFDQIILSPNEIGTDVYIELIKEQVMIYLRNILI